jgi:hypothetical protein
LSLAAFTNAGVPDPPTAVTATPSNRFGDRELYRAGQTIGGSAITGYTVTSNPAGGVDANAGTTLRRTRSTR